MNLFSIFPEAASEFAVKADLLHWALTAHTLFFTFAVFGLGFGFALRYRRKSDTERPRPVLGSTPLEVGFMLVPLVMWMGFFFWGAWLYFDYASPPKNAMEVYVTGKQWMFHTQHPEGQREINELHVPTGRPVKVTMTSEDVLHSFFIPAFRIKRDLVPGRYSNLWFTATKPGRYPLFCNEYCGTQHSGMIGWIYAMEPAAYDAWLSGDVGGGMGSMADQGEKMFAQLGCTSCHRLDMQGRCPNLTGVYGSQVQLQGGNVVTADENYLRESILNSQAKIVAGYQNIMPSYQGQINEQNLLRLIAYIKSIGQTGGSGSSVGAGGSAGGIGTRGGSSTTQPGRGAGAATSEGPGSGRNDNTTKFRGLGTTQ